jgi:hypothetical protein
MGPSALIPGGSFPDKICKLFRTIVRALESRDPGRCFDLDGYFMKVNNNLISIEPLEDGAGRFLLKKQLMRQKGGKEYAGTIQNGP